jgi:hypothetical protein
VADVQFKARFSGAKTIAADDGFVFTAPVGRYEPNAWGLYVANFPRGFRAGILIPDKVYYKNSAAADPRGPSSATSRVIRGGGWNGAGGGCRSAYRGSAPEFRINNLGFRVARVPRGPADADPDGTGRTPVPSHADVWRPRRAKLNSLPPGAGSLPANAPDCPFHSIRRAWLTARVFLGRFDESRRFPF